MKLRGLWLCALAAACAHAPAPRPAPTLRLPAGARPTHYALELWVDPDRAVFTGRVEIDLWLDAPSDMVWLNATGLEVRAAQLNPGAAARPARARPSGEDFLGVAWDEPIQGPARLRLDYQGKLDAERTQGLYRRKDGDAWYVYNLFEPLDARRAFPCFDEPGFKVPWDLTLHVPKRDVALFDSPAVSDVTDGETRTVTFERTPPLPSYLVALAVGPFELVEAGTAGDHGTPLRFVVPAGRVREVRYAREVTSKIVSLLERYFGGALPVKKLDVLAVADSGGMEHPGLVALAQSLTLVRPEEETPQTRREYADLAAHELAHYWFGDLVTTAWWNDTWLNEGFAQWMDAKIVSQLEPGWHYEYDRLMGGMRAQGMDSLVTATPIRHAIASNDDVVHSFDGSITYEKGAALAGMYERWLGPEKFQAFIREYLSAHAQGSATGDQFLAAFAAHAGPELAESWKGFLDQPGVPLVRGTARCGPGGAALELSQERYRPAGAEPAAPERWVIPVCATYQAKGAEQRACAWLRAERGSLPLPAGCPEWFVLNAQGAGYYVSGYTPGQLSSLVQALGKLGVADRLRLASDVSASVARGEVPAGDALRLVAPYAGDPSLHVFEASFELLGQVSLQSMDEPLRERFHRFVRATYGPRARALGWLAKPAEPDDDSQIRLSVVPFVAYAHDEALEAQARTLADEWLSHRRVLPLEVVHGVLSAAARSAGAPLLERLVSQARTEEDRERRRVMLGAAGHVPDPKLLDRALSLSLDRAVEPGDALQPLYNALADYRTASQARAFVEAHFGELAARMSSEDTGNFIGFVANTCDEAEAAHAQAFFEPLAKKYQNGARRLAESLEGDRLCAASWRRNKASVEAFLAAF